MLDECGEEQDGVNFSEYFKAYNNDQLDLGQSSDLGIKLGPVNISSIGQADDVNLLSDDPHSLQGLLDLFLYYCDKYHISLSATKTKPQLFSNNRINELVVVTRIFPTNLD